MLFAAADQREENATVQQQLCHLLHRSLIQYIGTLKKMNCEMIIECAEEVQGNPMAAWKLSKAAVQPQVGKVTLLALFLCMVTNALCGNHVGFEFQTQTCQGARRAEGLSICHHLEWQVSRPVDKRNGEHGMLHELKVPLAVSLGLTALGMLSMFKKAGRFSFDTKRQGPASPARPKDSPQPSCCEGVGPGFLWVWKKALESMNCALGAVFPSVSPYSAIQALKCNFGLQKSYGERQLFCVPSWFEKVTRIVNFDFGCVFFSPLGMGSSLEFQCLSR